MYGVVYFTEKMLEYKNKSIEGKTVTISGSGNVAQYATEKCIHLGAKVVTMSDSSGYIYDPEGINQEKLTFIMDLKNIKRVSGFLGTKGMPVPVSDKEIEKILGQIKDGVTQSKSTIDYSVGEKVQVIDGPFASFSGMIEDIDEDRSRVKVSVSIFGRPTPVDLDFNQIEKGS